MIVFSVRLWLARGNGTSYIFYRYFSTAHIHGYVTQSVAEVEGIKLVTATRASLDEERRSGICNVIPEVITLNQEEARILKRCK